MHRCKQCQKCVSLQENEGHRERAITAERMRITACKDRRLQGSLSLKIAEGKTVTAAIVGVQEDTDHVCIPMRCHTWKCVGKTMGPCVAVLCVDGDTVHGCCKTIGLTIFCSKQVCCTRSAE